MNSKLKTTLLTFPLLACLLLCSVAAKAAPIYTYATDTAAVQAPVFPGGEQELMRYMAKSVRYPVQAYPSKTVGAVVVQATIDSDGKIRNPKVVHRSKAALETEALGVVRRMPKWKPARKAGEAIAATYLFEFYFMFETAEGEKRPSVVPDMQNLKQLILAQDSSAPIYVTERVVITAYTRVGQ